MLLIPRILCFMILLYCGGMLNTSAYGDTILKFNFGNAAPAGDFSWDGNLLKTVDDGDGATFGQQNSNLSFNGFLDPLYSDFNQGASLTVSGIIANGTPIDDGFDSIFQATVGGTFLIYSPSNVLQLSGTFGTGLINGDFGSPTANFFNTSPVNFTGGILQPLLMPNSGNFALALNNVKTNGNDGLVISNNGLVTFTADATGQIEADPSNIVGVPEPTSILPALLGLTTIGAQRKRRALNFCS